MFSPLHEHVLLSKPPPACGSAASRSNARAREMQDLDKSLKDYGVTVVSRILVLKHADSAQKRAMDVATERERRIKRLRHAVDAMAVRGERRSQYSLQVGMEPLLAATEATCCTLLWSRALIARQSWQHPRIQGWAPRCRWRLRLHASRTIPSRELIRCYCVRLCSWRTRTAQRSRSTRSSSHC